MGRKKGGKNKKNKLSTENNIVNSGDRGTDQIDLEVEKLEV